METNINKIKKLAEEKKDENWEFRSFLKICDILPQEVDSIVHNLYQEVSAKIDCKDCGNCCREVKPVLEEEDIEKFSEGLRMSAIKFKQEYLVRDKDSKGFMFNKKPCPFLRDNLCQNYSYRPQVCVSYPHLHKEDFVFRLIRVIENCSVCPIVFNVYEHLKDELWHENGSFSLEDFNLEL